MVMSVLPVYQASGRVGDRLGGFEAYRQETQDVFEICLPRTSDGGPFAVRSWNLGGLLLNSVDAAALDFDRDRRLVAVSGLDHFLIALYVGGGFSGTVDDKDIDVRPGDICVLDLTRTLKVSATRFHNLSLVIPRAVIEASVDDPGTLHGLVLRRESPLTDLLSSHIRLLHDRISHLNPADAEAASRATVGFVAAVLSGHCYDRPKAALSAISPLRAAMQLIDSNLHDPTLNIRWLARARGVSRSALYRLFESRGGVAHYIREQRLIHAAMDLATPNGRPGRIADVARRWGFSSHAVFTRAFQAYFGVSPSEARRRTAFVRAFKMSAPACTPPELAVWLKTLRVRSIADG